jgi:hypothetical protein
MQTNAEVEAFRSKFAGSQAERSSKAEADAEAKKVADKLKGTKLSGTYDILTLLCRFCVNFMGCKLVLWHRM